MKKTLIISLTVILASFTGCSPNIDKTKLDAYFDTLANNRKFMGSVAVSRNGESIYAKSVGFADIEHGLKANENSKYRIASISKTFTAALIFIAVDENKLNPDQTIDKFFPAINNSDKITIAHLLYHRSGISDDNSFTDHANQPGTEQETIERILSAGIDFEPDAKASYGNLNFILLSYILEKIYEKSFSEILEEKIVKPVGLKNTYCVNKTNVKDNECNSYVYGRTAEFDSEMYDWEPEPEIDLSILSGAAGIVSNAVDLTLFSDALFGGKLISNHSLQQMKTIKDGIGMGLVQIPVDSRTGFGHGGSIDGFRSIFAHFSDGNISFALTANGLNYNSNIIARVVLSAVYDKPFEIPEFKTYNVSDEDLDKYTGIYSSEQVPVKIPVIKIRNTLFGAKDVAFVPLKATEKDRFEFEEEVIVLEFNPIDKTMVLKEGNETLDFIRISGPEFKTDIYDVTDEESDKYAGIYSSEQIHLKVTVIGVYNKLFAHVAGRTSLMLLEATGKDKFEFAEEGIVLEFNPAEKTMTAKQSNRIFNFMKED